MKLHLLGTGTPILDEYRPATSAFLVEVGAEILLFDAGRGTTMHLLKQGFTPVDLAAIFLTHHHYDHICDLGEILMAAWHNGRTTPLTVYGPHGTADIVDALLNRVFARDIAFSRFLDPTGVDIHDVVRVTEVTGGWYYATDTWSIAAEFVNHGNTLGFTTEAWPCLGYRLEAESKVLAMGGDAVDCVGIRKLAKDADALLLSCYLAEEEIALLGFAEMATHVIATSGAVGKIAKEAGVQQLILTHFRKKSAARMRTLIDEVQKDFAGNLQIGEDLMVVQI